jgi:hypothetical protein
MVATILLAVGSPAGAEPLRWQGLYAGLYRGATYIDDSYRDQNFPAADDSLDMTGFITGLVGGYNHRYGQFLFGVEVDGGIVDAGDEPDGCLLPPCRLDWNNLGTFRGRLGWIFGEEDRFAIYATGGYAVSSWEWNHGAFGGITEMNLHGWLIGGGFEMYLFGTSWLSNKIEYNYIDFSGSEDFPTGTSGTGSYSADAHLVKFGLNIHF